MIGLARGGFWWRREKRERKRIWKVDLVREERGEEERGGHRRKWLPKEIDMKEREEGDGGHWERGERKKEGNDLYPWVNCRDG